MKQYQDLIDRLAGGKLITCPCGSKYIWKPILIGDVLEKMKEKAGEDYDYKEESKKILDCIRLWAPCGFTKSAQQILEKYVRTYRPIGGKTGKVKKQLTPQSKVLFDFLIEIKL